MIFDALLTPLLAALQLVFAGLPTWSFLGSVGISTSGAATLGQKMAMANSFLPLVEMVGMVVVTYTALLSIFTVYKIANWLYRHMPVILGCGPGGGG